ncbi:hypothetical protein F5148DRAFT_1250757, partial [Russula earlei]
KIEVWGAMRMCFLTWGMGASPPLRPGGSLAGWRLWFSTFSVLFSARPAMDRLVYSVECWEQPTYRISTTA